MKKFYSFVVAALVGLIGFVSQAAALTVTVQISDPSMADVYLYYYPGATDYENHPLSFNQYNQCLVEIPDGAYASMTALYVVPKASSTGVDSYLKSYAVYDADGGVVSERTVNRAIKTTISIPQLADGGLVDIQMAEMVDESFTLTVNGDPSKFTMMVYDREIGNIKEGTQQIQFKPTDSYIFIRPRGVNQLYEVLYNGQVVEPRGQAAEGNKLTYEYVIDNPQDGAELVITTDFPDVQCPVSIITNDMYDFIEYVAVDNVPVYNWQDPDFAVTMGAHVEVMGNRFDYLVNSLTINDVEKTPTNQVGLIVDAAVTIDFNVTEIIRNESFVLYVADNCEVSILSNNRSSYKDMPEGYSPSVKFNEQDNPWIIYIDPSPNAEENDSRYLFLNDELQSTMSSMYSVTVAQNDVVKCYYQAKKPELYNVSYTIDGLDAMPIITKDYVIPVTGDHKALPGTRIEVQAQEGVNITEVTVNGETVYGYAGNYVFVINDNSEVVIKGGVLEPRNITISANIPAGVEVLYAGNYRFDLEEGDNVFNLSEYDNFGDDFLSIYSAQGYKIESVVYNGEDVTGNEEYDFGGGRYIFTDMADGTSIAVEVSELVRDQEAVVFMHGIQNTYGGVVADVNGFENFVQMSDGYDFVKFAVEDTPLMVGIYGYLNSDYQGYVYLNDELLQPYGTFWEVEAVNGDVIKVYVQTEEPSFYDIEFKANGVDQFSIVKDYITPVELGTVRVLPLTYVEISGENIVEVLVNDESIAANENGVYAFDADGDATVQINGESSGVENVIVNASAEGRTYNLQGVEVGGKLPAGIYIKDGKKVYVK